VIPGAWAFVLLAAAAARVWLLLAEDKILTRPRDWVLDRLDHVYGNYDSKRAGTTWFEFVNCAWCFGFWIGLAWWGAWLLWPHATVVASVPFAISLVVGLTAALLHRLAK
jgi:hypothetical protein